MASTMASDQELLPTNRLVNVCSDCPNRLRPSLVRFHEDGTVTYVQRNPSLGCGQAIRQANADQVGVLQVTVDRCQETTTYEPGRTSFLGKIGVKLGL